MASEYAEALTDVVERTVRLMFPIEARLIEQRDEYKREAPFEVSGIISILGPTQGTIVISFPLDVARKLTGWMLDEENSDSCSEQDVCDCVGELANIVAGNLQPHLADGEARDQKISIPSVVVGPHRVVWSSKDTPCELMLFDTAIGEFAAEINCREVLVES